MGPRDPNRDEHEEDLIDAARRQVHGEPGDVPLTPSVLFKVSPMSPNTRYPYLRSVHPGRRGGPGPKEVPLPCGVGDSHAFWSVLSLPSQCEIRW